MTKPTARPNEATLRKFLLGTLPPDEAESAVEWVKDDPDAPAVLRNLHASDPVIEVLGATAVVGNTSSMPVVLGTEVQSQPPQFAGIPFEVGGFRIVRELGRGGMGVVYEAEDTKLKRRVALKVIAAQYADSPPARERFLREARAVAKIDHPNVVPVLHIGEDQRQLYLVMPLLKGETLDARLKREKRMAPAELERIAREVAAGLAAAHAVGLVHRDIKPANIWLEAGTGRVRVLDFGLAKPMDEADTGDGLTSAGAVLGTLHYMSPQQANGEPLDPRTDLFSLGAVLYHAATGQRPFDGPTKLAILYSVVNDKPKDLETLSTTLPVRLAALIRELLAKNPDARPNSATEVIEKLQDAPPATGAPRAARPRAFPRWALAAAVLLALGAAAFGAYQYVVSTSEGTLVVEAGDEADVRLKNGRIEIYGDDGKLKYTLKPGERSAKLPKGPYTIKVIGADGVEMDTNEFTMSRNGKVVVRVTPKPDAVIPPTGPGTGPKIAAPTENGSDRRAAEYVLSLGGQVIVHNRGTTFTKAADLPKEPFSLAWVTLHDRKDVTDAGLAAFAGCESLHFVTLQGTSVSDAGLRHFAACKGLKMLNLERTRVTDAGLAAFRDTPDLESLNLNDTAVTDAGLAHFAGRTKLKELLLQNTAVTDAGLARFQKCRDITYLVLSNTKTTDLGWSCFKDCKKLATLLLNGTQITDEALSGLSECKDLHSLMLVGTKVTGAKVAELSKELPKCRIVWDGGTTEPKKNAGDTDRRAAEYVLSVGGIVHVHVDNKEREVKAVADLPKEPFRLTHVTLDVQSKGTDAGLATAFAGCKNVTHLSVSSPNIGNNGLAAFRDCKSLVRLGLSGTDVTDEGLAHFTGCDALEFLGLSHTKASDAGLSIFKGCKKLSILSLTNTKVTDAGLVNFKGCTKLIALDLNSTRITDAGLAHFKDCREFTTLQLRDTKVTDAGLAHFSDNKFLRTLDLTQTSVTDAGVTPLKNFKDLQLLYLSNTKVTGKSIEVLKNARPRCQITWDGGRIEPDYSPARTAAEHVLHLGGKVRVNDQATEYTDVATLPRDPFRLTGADLGTRRAVEDNSLAQVEGWKNLTRFSLNDTKVSDAGLQHLKGCAALIALDLRETKVTKDGVAALATVLPKCRIVWDGGTIEPKK